MEIIYDTVDGVDVEKRIYRICQICFDDMVRSGEFLLVIPGLLKDQVGQVEYYYSVDLSVPCDSLDPDSDLESICSMQK